MALRRFGDIAVDPDDVVCVSRKVSKVESEKTGDEDAGTITEIEDCSLMVIKIDGVNLSIDISEQAADDLLDYIQRKTSDSPKCCPSGCSK